MAKVIGGGNCRRAANALIVYLSSWSWSVRHPIVDGLLTRSFVLSLIRFVPLVAMSVDEPKILNFTHPSQLTHMHDRDPTVIWEELAHVYSSRSLATHLAITKEVFDMDKTDSEAMTPVLVGWWVWSTNLRTSVSLSVRRIRFWLSRWVWMLHMTLIFSRRLSTGEGQSYVIPE